MWRQDRVHTRRFMRDHHTRCPTSAGFCRILLAAPRFIVANFARRKSAIIDPGPHPACKYFHEERRCSPRKKVYRAAARENSSVPASDLIQLNIDDRVLLSNYPSSTSHALKATKMPAQEELISQTDPIVLNVVEYYFMITMSAQ